MTDAELLARFTDISEKNLFPVQFGDGAMLIGLPPNDIYQLGFFAAFNECHLAVREYVDQMIVKGILDQQREARKLSRGEADRPLWEKHAEQERQALVAALAERARLAPDAPAAIVFKESSDNSQLSNTQNALRNLYKAVQKSRAVNDPLGMATAMDEAGKWF